MIFIPEIEIYFSVQVIEIIARICLSIGLRFDNGSCKKIQVSSSAAEHVRNFLLFIQWSFDRKTGSNNTNASFPMKFIFISFFHSYIDDGRKASAITRRETSFHYINTIERI